VCAVEVVAGGVRLVGLRRGETDRAARDHSDARGT
jgi:hypothetical protein